MTELERQQLEKLYSCLKMNANIEVIVNDLGTLSELHERGIRNLSMGRLLWKQKRLARFADDEIPLLGKDVLQEYRKVEYPVLAEKFAVNVVELDSAPQGIELLTNGNKYAIHIPWCLVTFGRICCIGSLNLERNRKFRITSPCNHECIYIKEIYNNSTNWPQALFREGKGVYCLAGSDAQRTLLNNGIGKVVIDTTKFPLKQMIICRPPEYADIAGD